MDRKVCPDCGREFMLEDETCVAKSFPDFWERLEAFQG